MEAADPELLVRQTLERIADKWTLLVIDALEAGPLRFSRIRDQIDGVTQKMLTKTLRQLERDGLVTRTVFAEVPPRVEYALTPMGHSLGEAVCAVWLWSEANAAAVAAARSRFDAEASA